MPILRDLFARQQVGGQPAGEQRALMSLPDGLRHWFQWSSDAGVDVTPETSLRFSAVYACIRILSESVAMLPMILYERQAGGGRQRATGSAAYSLLHDMPNPEISAFEFFELAMVQVLLYGNAYAEIEFDTDDRPRALWPLMAPGMTLRRDSGSGRLVYVYQHGERSFGLPAQRVWHIRGLGGNGYTGLSPIQLARQQIGLGLAAEAFGSKLFVNGAIPPAVLEYPGKVTSEMRQNIRAGWEARQGGLDNAHRIAVLEEGMTYKSIALPPEDVQFLQLRRFQIEEIARIFRVPPHMLADLERATFSNIEHQGQSFVTYSLLPWLRRIEQRSNMALLGEDRSRYYYEFMTDALQRGDLQARTQSYATMINWGIMSPNEARQRENLNDYEAGDQYLVPLNMMPAGSAGFGMTSDELRVTDGEQEREARFGKSRYTATAAGMSAQRARQVAMTRRRLQQVYLPLYQEAAQRLVNREANDIGNQAKRYFQQRNNTTEFLEWLRQFYAEHRQVIMEQLAGVSLSYAQQVAEAAAAEVGVADTPDLARFVRAYLTLYTERHSARALARLEEALVATDDPLAALNAELELWRTDRAGQIALDESVRAGSAMAVAAFEHAGVQRLRWVAYGETCPYCTRLDGRVIAISSTFIGAGESFGGGDGVAPLRPSRSVGHPPSHRGCDCQIIAA